MATCSALGCCFLRSLCWLAPSSILCGMAIPPPITGYSGASLQICVPSAAFSVMRSPCEARGIIQLGLLLLIATPVARVAVSIFGFAEGHDRMYVVVASIVLLILAYSLIGSSWSP